MKNVIFYLVGIATPYLLIEALRLGSLFVAVLAGVGFVMVIELFEASSFADNNKPKIIVFSGIVIYFINFGLAIIVFIVTVLLPFFGLIIGHIFN